MGHNITTWQEKSARGYEIGFGKLLDDLVGEHHVIVEIKRPERLRLQFRAEDGYIEGLIIRRGEMLRFQAVEARLAGEFSGSCYIAFKTILACLFQHYEALIVWEGGRAGIVRLTISGEITETNIE